jgi:hypothetical protein
VTASGDKIESSELARALELDQRQQRQEDEAAMRREEEFAERLATELAKRSNAPTTG